MTFPRAVVGRGRELLYILEGKEDKETEPDQRRGMIEPDVAHGDSTRIKGYMDEEPTYPESYFRR